ncbi:uncharacterized protein LOC129573406 [Sitodiplosis mosellana]|uniref:uncharacterized protein LOC129573406 n=1 Tax=Sitodiplosis mosellana TaxID=263140 RepID=UPI002443EB10|nr:uncharacterized protein LOC129573406 [Sitodiplosis mosellana]
MKNDQIGASSNRDSFFDWKFTGKVLGYLSIILSIVIGVYFPPLCWKFDCKKFAIAVIVMSIASLVASVIWLISIYLKKPIFALFAIILWTIPTSTCTVSALSYTLYYTLYMIYDREYWHGLIGMLKGLVSEVVSVTFYSIAILVYISMREFNRNISKSDQGRLDVVYTAAPAEDGIRYCDLIATTRDYACNQV